MLRAGRWCGCGRGCGRGRQPLEMSRIGHQHMAARYKPIHASFWTKPASHLAPFGFCDVSPWLIVGLGYSRPTWDAGILPRQIHHGGPFWLRRLVPRADMIRCTRHHHSACVSKHLHTVGGPPKRGRPLTGVCLIAQMRQRHGEFLLDAECTLREKTYSILFCLLGRALSCTPSIHARNYDGLPWHQWPAPAVCSLPPAASHPVDTLSKHNGPSQLA
ncbi:hypothetical protein GQ53DRAFT_742305 [Thozetella sp. PMI_491]|nr:hypothetical protein GQ53DRAFT_742305 [Thozetella sp. PMI_491]